MTPYNTTPLLLLSLAIGIYTAVWGHSSHRDSRLQKQQQHQQHHQHSLNKHQHMKSAAVWWPQRRDVSARNSPSQGPYTQSEDPYYQSESSYSQTENSYSQPSGPDFLPPPSTHVTIRAGQSASLTCIVKNLGNRQVSWIRGRDLHVLSSGAHTFASDSRFNATGSGEAWTLTLRYTQTDDAGRYGCQVNTQPPLLSWYKLNVVEVRANIEGGGGTRYIQTGSTVTLTCVVKEQLLIPGLVLWYQGDGLVERDGKRVKVETIVANLSDSGHEGTGKDEQGGAGESREEEQGLGSGGREGQSITRSTLTIARAALRDSGNYSCWPSSGRPDSVLLHVIQGERPAAMQHGNSSARPSTPLYLLLHVFLLLYLRLS